MLQQHVDDVCVSLLRCLVKRCVSILVREKREMARGEDSFFLWLLAKQKQKKTTTTLSYFYLGFGIDAGALLQQEVHHFGISIVTGHNQGGISKLRRKKKKNIRHNGRLCSVIVCRQMAADAMQAKFYNLKTTLETNESALC